MRWQTLIAATGTVEWIEQLIDRSSPRRWTRCTPAGSTPTVRAALVEMAAACTRRAA